MDRINKIRLHGHTYNIAQPDGNVIIGEVPIASRDVLGKVKIGDGLDIDENGLLTSCTNVIAGTGLRLDGKVINHKNCITPKLAAIQLSKKLTVSDIFNVPEALHDHTGHIIEYVVNTFELPDLASSEESGFLSKEDKSKLDRIIGTNHVISNPETTDTSRTIKLTAIDPTDGSDASSSITIPSATQSEAGWMSAVDKKAVDNLHAMSWSHIADKDVFTVTPTDVVLNFTCRSTTMDSNAPSTVYSESIGAVSSTRAGVMIAQDKIELDRIVTTNFGLTGITPSATTVTINTTRLNINTNETGNTNQTIPAVTHTAAGVMIATDKEKLDTVEYNANYVTKVSQLQNDLDYQTRTQVEKYISDLVGGAPEALDTLKELADALNNNANFAETVAAQLALLDSKKVNKEVLQYYSTTDAIAQQYIAKAVIEQTTGQSIDHIMSQKAVTDAIANASGSIGDVIDDVVKDIEQKLEEADKKIQDADEKIEDALKKIEDASKELDDKIGQSSSDAVTNVSYASKKITKTKGGVTSDVVTIDQIKADIGPASTTNAGLMTADQFDQFTDYGKSLDELANGFDDVYTKSETDQRISEAVTGGKVDLTGYAKESWVEEKNYATQSWVTSQGYTNNEGTVKSVDLEADRSSHITVTGSTITESGKFTLNVEEGYIIPDSSTMANVVNGASLGNTAYLWGNHASAGYVKKIKVNGDTKTPNSEGLIDLGTLNSEAPTPSGVTALSAGRPNESPRSMTGSVYFVGNEGISIIDGDSDPNVIDISIEKATPTKLGGVIVEQNGGLIVEDGHISLNSAAEDTFGGIKLYSNKRIVVSPGDVVDTTSSGSTGRVFPILLTNAGYAVVHISTDDISGGSGNGQSITEDDVIGWGFVKTIKLNGRSIDPDGYGVLDLGNIELNAGVEIEQSLSDRTDTVPSSYLLKLSILNTIESTNNNFVRKDGIGTGLTITDGTLNHSNAVEAALKGSTIVSTAGENSGEVDVIGGIEYDGQGHIKNVYSRKITLKSSTSTGENTSNADTATKLATKRLLWGLEFDGSDNVSGSLSDVTSIKNTLDGPEISIVNLLLKLDGKFVRINSLNNGSVVIGGDGSEASFDVFGKTTFYGDVSSHGSANYAESVTAKKFVKTDGAPDEFLMADGDVLTKEELKQYVQADIPLTPVVEIEAGTGLLKDGNTINHKNSIQEATIGSSTVTTAGENIGEIDVIGGVSYDDTGHITKVYSRKITLRNTVSEGGSSSVADSAVKLATPHLIWGKSFDGTADVSGDLTNVDNIYSSGFALKRIVEDQPTLELIAKSQVWSIMPRNGGLRIGTGKDTDVNIDSAGKVSIGGASFSSSYNLFVTGGANIDNITSETLSLANITSRTVESAEFKVIGKSDDYVILAGGGTKKLSEISGGDGTSNVTGDLSGITSIYNKYPELGIKLGENTVDIVGGDGLNLNTGSISSCVFVGNSNNAATKSALAVRGRSDFKGDVHFTSKLIKDDGTSDQFLMANGDVKTISELKSEIGGSSSTTSSGVSSLLIGNPGTSPTPRTITGNVYIDAGNGIDIKDADFNPNVVKISTTVATKDSLGSVKSSTTGTTGVNYNVEVNSDGTMKVNVPNYESQINEINDTLVTKVNGSQVSSFIKEELEHKVQIVTSLPSTPISDTIYFVTG